MRNGVGTLQRRNNPFKLRQAMKRLERLSVRHSDIGGLTRFLQVGMFRTYPRVVQTRRNRVSRRHLAVTVLKKVTHGPVEYTRFSC